MTDMQHSCDVPRLSNAPIKEALIDIRVAFLEAVSTSALQSNYAKISDRFPVHNSLQRREFGIQGSEGQPPKVTTIGDAIIGYRYASDDERKIVQFRVDGFTFSQLEPYDKWAAMSEEAMNLWKVYTESVSPNSVTRIGVRYVNLLKLPPHEKVKEYLTAPPTIPEGLNQELDGFLTRVDIRQPEIEAHGHLTQALEAVHADHVSVILDIEAFVAKQFDPEEEEIWRHLDKLRGFKNRMFFNSITSKAMELYL